MEVDEKSPLTSVYKSHTYYFCSHDHKAIFDASPEKALQMATANK
jgi:YHS domain-containing protein